MNNIYELHLQYLDKEEIIQFRDHGTYDDIHIYNIDMGFYSSLEKIKQSLPTILSKETCHNDDILINIYAVEHTLNCVNSFTNYIFLDIEGNQISKLYYDETNSCTKSTLKPSLKKGDYVILISEYSDKTEIGIVSNVPNGKYDDNYNVLVGNVLHDHVHPYEQFMLPIEKLKEYGYTYKYESILIQDLETRLTKLGF